MSSDWLWNRLGDCCKKIGSGSTPTGGKDAYLDHGPFMLIRSQNIYNDSFRPYGLAFISAEQAKKLDGVSVEAGDILLNITGDSVARVCLALPRFLPARVNQHVAIIRPKPEILDSRFVRYFLASPYQQDLMLGMAAAGATRNALTKSMIEDFKVPCPPIAVQREIAEVLESLDDRITLLRETNATLEAIAQALFKSWFIDFDPVRAKMEDRMPEGMDEITAALFPDSFEETELGEVPRGWHIKPLSDVFELNPSRPLKKGTLAPYLDMASVATSGHRTEAPILREMGSGTKFCNGDTLLARITPCLENGKAAFVDCLKSGEVCWGSTEFLVLRPKGALPDYVAYLLCKHRPFLEFAIQSMAGTSGRQRIQNEALGRYPLAIPPDPISKACGQIFSAIQLSIAINDEQSKSLSSVRDALLPRLVSGGFSIAEGAI